MSALSGLFFKITNEIVHFSLLTGYFQATGIQFFYLLYNPELSVHGIPALCTIKPFPFADLYCPGVIPVDLLNVSVNALCEENPSDRDISEMVKSEYASIFFAAPTLTLIMNSLNDTPTSFEKKL